MEANALYNGIAPIISTTASIRHNSFPVFEKLRRFFLNFVPSLPYISHIAVYLFFF